MDKKIRATHIGPNYKQIYYDFIASKCPDKTEIVKHFLAKDELSISDVLKINNILFSNTLSSNQKFKSYDKEAVFEILNYQKKHKLNNSQLGRYFKLSRNTIAKWKNLNLDE